METSTKTEWVERPWGGFTVVYHTPHIWVKTLVLNPGARTSLQIHKHREEHWHHADNRLHAVIGEQRFAMYFDTVYHVDFGVPHRIINPSRYTLSLTEVAYGDPDEDDIIRLDDEYGRED